MITPIHSTQSFRPGHLHQKPDECSWNHLRFRAPVGTTSYLNIKQGQESPECNSANQKLLFYHWTLNTSHLKLIYWSVHNWLLWHIYCTNLMLYLYYTRPAYSNLETGLNQSCLQIGLVLSLFLLSWEKSLTFFIMDIEFKKYCFFVLKS